MIYTILAALCFAFSVLSLIAVTRGANGISGMIVYFVLSVVFWRIAH